ncbi:hypothetical protein L313_2043 [Acinetobacter haemolyticus CIP 64.3 = MTCC 9819]|nr:hypothetical protein HMPREF0023_0441 [Acinetobacter sp. ATCC 27244]EPR88831.1 hypothetical protein L313_2043 [Acinetobacter haemolyticus CIP 64.3 = MTCC 9819]
MVLHPKIYAEIYPRQKYKLWHVLCFLFPAIFTVIRSLLNCVIDP